MNKANSLKQHLLAEVPELQGNPDKLLVFIDQGRARSTVATGLSFEYGYTLNAILTDFAGHPDAVIIPVIAWMKVNQPDLMENLAQAKDAIQFEADILANDLVDMSITLPLTERVIVKQQPDGTLDITHADEPPTGAL
ncbi:phage tail protein [Ectopseudomonas khazarica]|uniref:phage tail protein n=1 Tax=Ectopseudomonas khazarica TaxID=2502979 RepID=UPI003B947E89